MRYVSGMARALGMFLVRLAIAGCSLPFIGNGGPLPKGYSIIEDVARIPAVEGRKVERSIDGYRVEQEIGGRTFVFTRGLKACKLSFPGAELSDADCNGDVDGINANNSYGDDDKPKFGNLFKEADS
ncbi:MAG: hypothetical protein HY515_03910, partial [Candidatus Aenigmarchaeota archaeon]|nr:hypothetical protein [Candidatus Aenigmarchaeota archaeon]